MEGFSIEKTMLALLVIMAIIFSVGLYLGPEEGASTPISTPAAPTPTPAPATPPTSEPALPPTPEPVDLQPLPTQQIELTLPGVYAGTYEIEFRRNLEAGRKITGSVEWEEGFVASWRLKIRGPEGAPIKAWNVEDQSHDFEYTATIAGEYTLRIINQKDPDTHHGIMKITGSWEQTEY